MGARPRPGTLSSSERCARGTGGLETGRALDYSSAHDGDGETHAKLLVSIANAVGIPINSFGYTGHGDGPLQGLYA